MIQDIAKHYLPVTFEDVSPAAMQDQRDSRETETRQPSIRAREAADRISELRQASFYLARDLQHPDVARTQEATNLAHKLESMDNSASAIARRAARSITRERQQAIDTLNALFARGAAPSQPLSGEYSGELLATTLWAPLDALGRFVSRLYFPWVGKRFDPETSTGENMFLPSARFVGHLPWPLYFGYKPYGDGLYTGFTFTTFTAPGVQDPEVTTFKLYYDNPDNPLFLVRSVLDEVVQITHNYYLGKAFLWRSDAFQLAAFFALRAGS